MFRGIHDGPCHIRPCLEVTVGYYRQRIHLHTTMLTMLYQNFTCCSISHLFSRVIQLFASVLFSWRNDSHCGPRTFFVLNLIYHMPSWCHGLNRIGGFLIAGLHILWGKSPHWRLSYVLHIWSLQCSDPEDLNATTDQVYARVCPSELESLITYNHIE
ncbi:hypothetical protein J5N97_005516 [Dioscorea zingiberensis]|uniref:Uncharacterized protein n=1 Tax=Dioscorea zingiberensis TaxID=325984 RepID=A0A9D5DAM0_9LILI|nr:hypothetical protein J5N97_005516 [Dioscorea zingiberensis]